jgi:hypothetical protein
MNIIDALTEQAPKGETVFELFFEMANQKQLVFKLPSMPAPVTISQDLSTSSDSSISVAGNGIVWETSVVLAIFLSRNLPQVHCPKPH